MAPRPLLATAVLLLASLAAAQEADQHGTLRVFLSGAPLGRSAPEPARSVQRGPQPDEEPAAYLGRVAGAAEGLGADAEQTRLALELYSRLLPAGPAGAPERPEYAARVGGLLHDPFGPGAPAAGITLAAYGPGPAAPAAARPAEAAPGAGIGLIIAAPPSSATSGETTRAALELPDRPVPGPRSAAVASAWELAEAATEKAMLLLLSRAGQNPEPRKSRDLDRLAARTAKYVWGEFFPDKDLPVPKVAGELRRDAPAAASGPPPPQALQAPSAAPAASLKYDLSLKSLHQPHAAVEGRAGGLKSKLEAKLDPLTLKTDARLRLEAQPVGSAELDLRKDSDDALTAAARYTEGPVGLFASWSAQANAVDGLAGGVRYGAGTTQWTAAVGAGGAVTFNARHSPTSRTALDVNTYHDTVNGVHDVMLRLTWDSVETALREARRLLR